jgi:SAM-dependent methyltransferase
MDLMIEQEELGEPTSLPAEIAPAAVDFLLSTRGQEALSQLGTVEDLSDPRTVALLMDLRRSFSAEEAAALLTMARLHQKARNKFPSADQLYFTAESLEQATHQVIAEHRAHWIHQHAPPGSVLDLGCGIGGDTLALARYRPVIAYETSSTRLRFAQANAKTMGLAGQVEFHLKDWTAALMAGKLPSTAAAFADPARRVNGRRVFSLYQMQPPLDDLLRLARQIPALGVKVAPGVQDEEIPGECGVEFISHERTCKEAVLWFGPLADGPTQRWASVHDGERWHRLNASLRPPPLGPLEPGQYLHEPDPAVIRAGAFWELCEMLGAHLFDAQIAYLVGNRPGKGSAAQPFVQSFQIDEILPGSLKQINRRLQALNIGQVELKKRGAPIEPETLRPRLKLVPGGRDAVIFWTRQGDQRLNLLARRI